MYISFESLKLNIMKKLFLVVFMGLFSWTTLSQDVLAYTFETESLAKWNKNTSKWDNSVSSNAYFEIYCKNNETNASNIIKVIAYMDSTNNYTVGTTFYGYEQIYNKEEDGFSYHIYLLSKKSQSNIEDENKTNFFKIQILSINQMVSIQLTGYYPESYLWKVKRVKKK